MVTQSSGSPQSWLAQMSSIAVQGRHLAPGAVTWLGCAKKPGYNQGCSHARTQHSQPVTSSQIQSHTEEANHGTDPSSHDRPGLCKPSRRSLLAWALFFGSATKAIKPASAMLVEEDITDRVFQLAAPSVVAVVNKREQQGEILQDSEASGFVWDSRGYIVTNYHCIQPVLNDRVGNMFTIVKLGDSGQELEFPARIRATDSSHDLAVLQINAPSELLRPIRVGSSADVRVGQSVFSIGSPYGLSKTFTAGVVGGLNRGIPSPAGTIVTGAIQTDASINSGNSGGPLLDSGGRLIGISTATFNSNKSMGRGSGVNFAVSVDTLMKLVPNMIVYANASGKGV